MTTRAFPYLFVLNFLALCLNIFIGQWIVAAAILPTAAWCLIFSLTERKRERERLVKVFE